MKKALKITGTILLTLLLILTGVLIFFNSRYNKVNQEIKETLAATANDSVTFYHFKLQQDSLTEFILLPTPKSISYNKGQFDWPAQWKVLSELPEAPTWVNRLLKNPKGTKNGNAKIQFTKIEGLSTQAYELQIKPSLITINYSNPVGAYYAAVSLHHLKKQFPKTIECISIKDQPDLEIRGVMLDISRDKVPQLHTLKELINQLSLLN